jgi:hypothetical protein
MTNLDELEQLAKAAITSGLPGDRMMFALKAMDPEGMLTLIAEVRALRERRNGPGTPAARFSYLLHELEALFPGVVDPVLSDSPETKLLDAVRALREDAERYRWARQGKPLWVKVPVKDKQVEYFIGAKLERLFPERFDAAVDAARAKESK